MSKNIVIKDSNGNSKTYENVDKVVFSGTDGNDVTFAEERVDRLQWKCDNVKTLKYEFEGYTGTSLDEVLTGLDTSKVTRMKSMFDGCQSLSTLDLSSFDTSSVTDMSYMFNYCAYLISLDIGGFNTSNVTDMRQMFGNCLTLQSLDLSSFDTSSVTDMSYMFNSCARLITVKGKLSMEKVTNLSNIVRYCTNLTNLTLTNIKKSGLQIGSGTSWGHLLTVDSLINTVKELWDYSSGTTTYTITMSTTSKETLADVYVKLVDVTDEMLASDPYADQKMPCEVCESTDEGAMLITDYATLKQWTIA